jgi:aspartyl-tRNA(Asn)/glutamyl-tRNA(Gln) amidotransferase subunit C
MAVSREEVMHIAELARLKLTPDEVERYQAELTSILDYVGQLRQVDTAGIQPAVTPAICEKPLREDSVGLSLSSDEALANAPAKANNMFSVPRVIDN